MQLTALQAMSPIYEMGFFLQDSQPRIYRKMNAIISFLEATIGTTLRHGILDLSEDGNRSHLSARIFIKGNFANGREFHVVGQAAVKVVRGFPARDMVLNCAYTNAAQHIGHSLELLDQGFLKHMKGLIARFDTMANISAFLTCQHCGKEITFYCKSSYGDLPVSLQAGEVANASRSQFGERLCSACAIKAGREQRRVGDVVKELDASVPWEL